LHTGMINRDKRIERMRVRKHTHADNGTRAAFGIVGRL